MKRRHAERVVSDPFRAAAETGDVEALVATLAPDVVLHSPVTFHPYVGRETVGGILRFVSDALEGWRCIDELRAPGGLHGLVFAARVGDREIEGLDLLNTGAGGLITELTVMIRPLSGLIALAEAIGPRVEAAGVTPSPDI
jgi:SnoaL-like domain